MVGYLRAGERRGGVNGRHVQQARRRPWHVPIGIAEPVEQVEHRIRIAQDVGEGKPATEEAQQADIHPRQRGSRGEQPVEQRVCAGQRQLGRGEHGR